MVEEGRVIVGATPLESRPLGGQARAEGKGRGRMLKRCLASLVVAGCLALTLLPVSPVSAGESVQLTGKAQIKYISVSLETADTLDYGLGEPGQTVARSFTVRNTGSLAADWDILGGDATDAANDVWSIGPTAGPSQFVWEVTGAGLNSLKLSKSWQRLVNAVPANAVLDVELAFTFPTGSLSALVHSVVATLRATASGTTAPSTTQRIEFDNTRHETLTAQANTPIDIIFVPSTSGCSTSIDFPSLTSPVLVKTSLDGQDVAYHSEGIPAGTYQWKCYMDDCCYGMLVVR
jgi:hypothetical protein